MIIELVIDYSQLDEVTPTKINRCFNTIKGVIDRTKLELCCDVVYYFHCYPQQKWERRKRKTMMGDRYRMLSTNQNEVLEDWNQRILECF